MEEIKFKTKVCTKCKEELPATSEYFHKAKANKDGLDIYCKECNSKKGRSHYKANKKKITERQKAYRETNKEKIKAYRDANKEKLAEYIKAYNKDNKEEIAKRRKFYYEANKEEIAKYYEANKEKIAETKKAYYKANKEKIAKSDKANNKKLPDSTICYAIKRQTGLTKDSIPPEMIETRRLLIQLKRKLKNRNDEKA